MGGSPWNLRIGNPLFIGANLNIFFFPKWSHMVWTVDQRGAGAGPRDGTLKRKGCGCKLCFPPRVFVTWGRPWQAAMFSTIPSMRPLGETLGDIWLLLRGTAGVPAKERHVQLDAHMVSCGLGHF